MKAIIATIALLGSFGVFGQNASTSCGQAENICNSLPVPFTLNNTPQSNPTVPPAGSISNPSSNPGGNMGCLLAGELLPNWFILNVTSNGQLMFNIGAPGGSGFFDWALWPYNPATGCAAIQNNQVSPAACNWNASPQGFTGMSSGGPPPGGVAGNFQQSISVLAGQQYILMFSNYSNQNGVVNITFPPSGASIGCSADTPDQTICLGDQAVVDIVVPPTFVNPIFNWLVTTGVSNTSGGTGVIVTPTVTTDYYVQVQDNVLNGASFVDTFTITVVNPPMPNAGVNQNICLGSLVSLSGTPDDPINNTSMWLVNTAIVFPTPTVNFIPNNTNLNTFATANQMGTYYFILQETNATCGPVQDTVVVTVSDLTVTASGTSPSCAGQGDGTITITSAGAIEYSYDNAVTWVPNNSQSGFSAGNYTVCARTALGCQKCVTVTITEPAPMTISLTPDITICENGSASMTASATGGTTFYYHWDNSPSLGASQTVTPTASTSYTVYAENEVGCLSPSATINVTVRPPLTGTISSIATICPGFSTDLTATVVGGLGAPYTYTWSSGNTSTGAGSNTINVSPGATTTYTVTIEDNCESTPLVMTTNVVVSPLPVPSVNVLNPVQCEPAVFDIVNTTDPALSQYTYWLVGGEQEFVNQDTITTAQMWAGEYDLQLIVTSFEGCIDSLTWIELLSVDPKPVADFKYTPNPVLMFNTQVKFTNYSFNGYTYQWFFEDGMPSQSTQMNVDVMFPDGIQGRYDVMLITTSELGCVDTMEHELIVYPEVLIYAPNAFTPDGDEHNQSWRVYMEGIDVYDFELLIYNRWGELIWESNDVEVGWDGTYGGQIVEQGMYTWVIRTKDLMNDAKYTYEGHVSVLK